MKISACMITKNEENNIEGCINSYKESVDEIIVVDTGSTDKTVEKAKSLGAKVFHYTWENDFSKAKNNAISKAIGDWIIFLDADEYFSQDTSQNLVKIIQKYHEQRNIQAIFSKMINIDINNNNQEIGEHRCFRIFRNLEGAAYEGHIHEDIRYNGKSPIYAFDEGILIYHTGYAPCDYTNKLKRNLDLLLKEKEHNADEYKNNLYLANTYIGLKEYEKALECIRKVKIGEKEAIGYRILPLEIFFEAMSGLKNFSDEYMDKLKIAESMYPNQPVFAYYHAVAYYEQKRYTDALKYFARTLELNSSYNDPSEKNPIKDDMDRVHYFMGTIYELKKDIAKAMESYLSALSVNKYHTESFARFCVLVKRDKPEEIVSILNSIYDINKENQVKFLVEQLSKYKIGMVLYYYWKIWYEKFGHQDIYYLMALVANNKYEQAYQHFINEDESAISHLYITACALLTGNAETIEEALQKVSASYQTIIRAFAELDDIVVSDNEIDQYCKLLDIVIATTNLEIIRLFLSIKNRFSVESKTKICEILKFWNCYEMMEENKNEQQ